MAIDLRELLASTGETAANLSDGTFDEGDIVVLVELKEFLEGLIEGQFEDDIQRPLVQKILKGYSMLVLLALSSGILDDDD